MKQGYVAISMFLLTFGLAFPAGAAFDPIAFPGDDAVAPAAGDQLAPVIERGGDQYLAVWMDSRTNLVDTNRNIEGAADLYAARLDANGALVDSIPIPISTNAYDQYGPLVSWNGTDWLVVWNYRVYDFPNYILELRGVRVSAGGEVLDAEPIVIRTFEYSDDHVFDVASNGDNWAVFLTQTYPVGLGTYTRLIAQRVSADGQLVGGTPYIFSPSCCYFFHGGVTYANGEYFVVFEGFNTLAYEGVVGLRVSESLQNLTGSSPMNLVFPPGDYPMYFRRPTVTTNGTDYLLAWDYRVEAGESRIFACRVNSSFQALDGNGIDVSGDLGNEYDGTPLASWSGTDWVVGWAAPNLLELARIDAGGAVLDPGGADFADFRAGDLASAAPNGVLAVWADLEAGGPQPWDIHEASVAADFTAGSEGAVSLGAPSEIGADLASHGSGFVAVNVSRVSGEARVHARVLTADGYATTAEPIVIATGAALSHAAVAFDGSRHLVVWSDDTQGKIFAKRLLPNGTVVDGTAIEVMNGGGSEVAAFADTFLVVGSNGGAPRAARVRGSDGALLDGTAVSLGAAYAADPVVTALGNRWLVAWNRRASAGDSLSDVRAAFVDRAGATPGEFVVAANPSTYEGEVALATGLDQALFVWSDDRNGDDDRDLYARRILTDGTLGDGSGIRVTPVAGDQFAPSVAYDPAALGYVIAAQDLRNMTNGLDRRSDLSGWRLTIAGEVPDPDGFAIAVGEDPEIEPSLTFANGDIVMVASYFDGAGPAYAYRLGFVNLSGVSTSVAEATDVPSAIRLHGPSPNPFNPTTTLRFEIPEAAPVRLAIYDLAGRRVTTLVDGRRDAGRFDAVWNGKDAGGRDVSSGVYFARFESGKVSETRKMLLVR